MQRTKMQRTTLKIILFVIGLMAAAHVCAASLYREGEFQSLTADRKAHVVGDALTVLVYEDSSATSAANTSTGRDAEVGATLVHGVGS
jgi:flagellar L-ring protein precursor FlgH